MHSFKLPRSTNVINRSSDNAYDIKENFSSYSTIDIPPNIAKSHNVEGMSNTWLTGWTLAKLSATDNTQEQLYHLYINEDDGNFASGFSHYLHHKQLGEFSDLEWKLIRQIPSEDPYNFHRIHKHNIIYSDVNYSSINKLVMQIPDFIDLFVANDSSKSLLSILILCLLKIKDSGICFIKLPQLWDTVVINFIIYCCIIADCKLIILPWSGIYLELRNIDIYIFDNNYKYLMDCLCEDKNIFPENVIEVNKEIINIMKESRNWEVLHLDISTHLFDAKNIIPLNNYQSVFSIIS